MYLITNTLGYSLFIAPRVEAFFNALIKGISHTNCFKINLQPYTNNPNRNISLI